MVALSTEVQSAIESQNNKSASSSREVRSFEQLIPRSETLAYGRVSVLLAFYCSQVVGVTECQDAVITVVSQLFSQAKRLLYAYRGLFYSEEAEASYVARPVSRFVSFRG